MSSQTSSTQCCPQPKTSNASCSHLRAFKECGGIETFHTIQQYLQTTRLILLQTTKPPIIRCMNCQTTEGRLFICLQCTFFGCWREGHITQHFKDSSHYLAVETSHNQIYCQLCGDFVYDPDFELAVAVEKTNVLSAKRKITDDSTTQNSAQYLEWVPNRTEAENLTKSSRRFLVPTHMMGLRGLNNLGNTCFMNSILQCFLHNPLLRNYFLSDMHNRKHCQQQRSILSSQQQDNNKKNINNSNNNNNNNVVCLACELDFLFTQFFSGIRAPYTPHNFLHSMWKYSAYLAGYDQQDAHEFLISTLNGVHSDCRGTPKDCHCVVHQIFNGILRSDVTCAQCNHTSTAYDPFIDISLDLDKSRKNEATDEPYDRLLDCLDRFTHPERLSEQFLCSGCNTYQHSTKQLSMHVLPIVLCFHIKRFESGTSKLDTFVEFPESLDMSPYLSINKLRKPATTTTTAASNNNITVVDNNHTTTTAVVAEKKVETYELFAVVNHQGRMENGHYTSFVRHANMWFKCDDAMITKASAQSVLKSKGYLLFYVQKHVQYAKKNLSQSQ